MLKEITRLLNWGIPTKLPATGVLTFYPNLNNPVAIVTDGAANVYGVNATALLANANPRGLWVVGIYATAFNAAAVDYSICVSSDPTGVAPVTILGEVPFQTQTTVVADHHEYIPFYRPIWIPAATIVCLAGSSGNAAGDTCAAWAVCVLNMDN